MPFVANMDDEDENKKGGTSPVSGDAVHLAPSSGVGTPGAAGSTGAGKPEAGGSFASLDKYIAANQGQAAPLANKITSGINDQYNTLNQGNQSTLSNLSGQVQNAPGYTKGDNALISEEQSAPVSFANDSGKVSSFQKQLTDSYNGPLSAEGTSDFQTQQAKVNDAIAKGNTQTGTEAGRKQLVQQNSAAPTAGVTALNSAILSEDPNYLGQVQNAYKPFQKLVTGLGSGAADIDKTIASEQADATSAAKAANDAITGQITGLNSSVTGNLSNMQQQASAQNAAIKKDLANPGSVTQDEVKALGLTPDQWQQLRDARTGAATSQVVQSNKGQFGANTGTANIDLTQWLKQQDPNAVLTASNTATADDYQKAKAFQTLLGGLNLNAPSLVLNPSDAAQAGTAPTNLNAFGFQPALDTANQTQAAERTSAQAYVDALQSGADEEHAQLAAANAAKNAAVVGAAGIAQTPIAATTAAVSGLAGAGKNLAGQVTNTFSSPTNAAKNIAANVATGGLYSAGQAAAAGVNQAVKTVSNIFCFHPWTEVEMADGSTRAIKDIRVGDETRGGLVLATTRGVGTKFYWYEGVLVTGKHAVKEDGRWVRVEDSARGKHFPYLTEVVCNLVTEKHRIYAHGVEFADEYENDNYENLNMRESLDELNKNERLG